MSIKFYESANYIIPENFSLLFSLENTKISYFNVILAVLNSINSYMITKEIALIICQKYVYIT